jgi:hypothetical protein
MAGFVLVGPPLAARLLRRSTRHVAKRQPYLKQKPGCAPFARFCIASIDNPRPGAHRWRPMNRRAANWFYFGFRAFAPKHAGGHRET